MSARPESVCVEFKSVFVLAKVSFFFSSHNRLVHYFCLWTTSCGSISEFSVTNALDVLISLARQYLAATAPSSDADVRRSGGELADGQAVVIVISLL